MTALTVLGPCESVLPNWSQLVWPCLALSGLVATCLALSQLVWSPVALRAGPGVPIPKDFQTWYHQAASFMPAGRFRFLQAGGTEGRSSRSGTLDR